MTYQPDIYPFADIPDIAKWTTSPEGQQVQIQFDKWLQAHPRFNCSDDDHEAAAWCAYLDENYDALTEGPAPLSEEGRYSLDHVWGLLQKGYHRR